MATRYEVHPTIGVGRLGDSEHGFYLAPERIGGLPLECDSRGNPKIVGGRVQPVVSFKDADGHIVARRLGSTCSRSTMMIRTGWAAR